MGTTIHQVLVKTGNKICLEELKLEQTLYDAEHGASWLGPTNSPTVHHGHQPSPSVSLSIPILGRGPQFVSVRCSCPIRLCILAFSAQLHMVGCPDLGGLDLPQSAKEEHTANEETVASLATALSGAAQGPKPELGFMSPLLGCPAQGTAASHHSPPWFRREPNGSACALKARSCMLRQHRQGRGPQEQGLSLETLLQSIIAKSREFSMKHEDGGKPCSTQLSVNMFVHRPVIHLTLNILSIRQLMVKALSVPRARPTDKLRTKRSFQLRAPGEGRHADGHGGRECLGGCRLCPAEPAWLLSKCTADRGH